MAPVILKMDVHCARCARGIRKALKPVHGVEDVWVSVDTGLVVVAGYSLDASLLRWRIQSRARKPVTVVSDGAAEDAPPDNGQMVHLGPPGGYPAAYYGGGAAIGWAPAEHHHALHQYAPSYAHARYVRDQAAAAYHDDNPNGCCTMQ